MMNKYNYNRLAPAYNTLTFSQVYKSDVEFYAEISASKFADVASLSATQQTTLFWLLFARYANNPITNLDVEQWKAKLQAILYAYAPTYFKKMDVQKSIRALDLDELREGFKNIQNRAFNDATAPSTDTDTELDYINEQLVNKGKRSKAESYAYVLSILRTNYTEDFLDKFKILFKKVVDVEDVYNYISEEEYLWINKI